MPFKENYNNPSFEQVMRGIWPGPDWRASLRAVIVADLPAREDYSAESYTRYRLGSFRNQITSAEFSEIKKIINSLVREIWSEREK